jgi:predicted transcriptional regulator
MMIEKIMNPEPLTIRQEDDLYKAFYILHLDDSENILVLDNSKKVKGILTREQIMSYS